MGKYRRFIIYVYTILDYEWIEREKKRERNRV